MVFVNRRNPSGLYLNPDTYASRLLAEARKTGIELTRDEVKRLVQEMLGGEAAFNRTRAAYLLANLLESPELFAHYRSMLHPKKGRILTRTPQVETKALLTTPRPVKGPPIEKPSPDHGRTARKVAGARKGRNSPTWPRLHEKPQCGTRRSEPVDKTPDLASTPRIPWPLSGMESRAEDRIECKVAQDVRFRLFPAGTDEVPSQLESGTIEDLSLGGIGIRSASVSPDLALAWNLPVEVHIEVLKWNTSLCLHGTVRYVKRLAGSGLYRLGVEFRPLGQSAKGIIRGLMLMIAFENAQRSGLKVPNSYRWDPINGEEPLQ